MAQLVKSLPAMQETWVQSLGWGDPLEKGKATNSSILAWRILVHGVAKSQTLLGFPCSSVSKEFACSAGDRGSIPGLGRSLGKGNGNPLQYPCLENLMDRGTWWIAVHGVAKSRA